MRRTKVSSPALSRLINLSALVFVALVVIAACFAPIVATGDPLAQDAGGRLMPPGKDHLFGTDGLGRDVFSRVVYGARASIFVGSLAIALSAIPGVALGTLSAWRGRAFDLVVQRFVDLLLGFPSLVLAVVVVVSLKSSATSVALAIGVGLLPKIARLARASALSVRTEGYLDAARVAGASEMRTLLRHLLPNSLAPLVSQVSGYLASALVAEATLSFLGLGVPAPYPSWGRMLKEGATRYFETAPWAAAFPGLTLCLSVVCIAVVGDALTDHLRPGGFRRRTSRQITDQ